MRAPTEAASTWRRTTTARAVTAPSTVRQVGLPAPPPATTSSDPPGSSNSSERATSYATPSATARASSAGEWSGRSPANVAVASKRQCGARAPVNQGYAVAPRAPGGTAAAAFQSLATVRPVSAASQSNADPAAARPASTRKPSPGVRETCATAGNAPTGPGWGTETFAVVPHETIGTPVRAPVPIASQARSPAPGTTTVVSGSARAADHGDGRIGSAAVDGTTSGSRAASHPSARDVPSSAYQPVRDARVGSVTTVPTSRATTRS